MLRTITIAIATGALAAACVTEANYPERAAEVACDKLQECTPDFYVDGCEEDLQEALDAAIGECDNYRAGLAGRCLNAIEDLGCDETETPEPCEKFNEECGFPTEGMPVGEQLEAIGYGQLRVTSRPQ